MVVYVKNLTVHMYLAKIITYYRRLQLIPLFL